MFVTLRNEDLAVTIEDAGAQLASIRDAKGTEYLWQGDPAIWNRRAPLLFPVVARLKDSRYILNGKTYSMSIHGFCRSAPFTVKERSETSVTFAYQDTEETRAAYPFSFTLEVTYTLEGSTLVKTHRVENRSSEPMLYELGGHDGYRAPLREGESMSDYGVRLPEVTSITPYGMDAENMITPKSRTWILKEGRISLKPSDYGLDTVILDELPQRAAELIDGAGNVRVRVEFDDFPFLGIWSARKDFDVNYVCIEPWTSLPDAVFVGRELAEKRGVRTLAPGAAETLTYRVSFFPAQEYSKRI